MPPLAACAGRSQLKDVRANDRRSRGGEPKHLPCAIDDQPVNQHVALRERCDAYHELPPPPPPLIPPPNPPNPPPKPPPRPPPKPPNPPPNGPTPLCQPRVRPHPGR